MLRIIPFLLLTSAMLWSQPKIRWEQQPQFPQHSTGWPSVLPPPQGHIPALSHSIQGRPVLSTPGARPIHPAPFFNGGGAVWYPMVTAAPAPVVIVTQPAAPAPAAAPVVVVNPDYKPEVARPVMREYVAESKPYENFNAGQPKIFLLALKDGTLRQAVAFWAENGKLHYVQPDHKQQQLSLAELDREGTQRFNRERGVEIRLPE